MKLFNIIFCTLFVLFAALQYNDPDPYIWVPLYLYSAWLCYEASRQKYYYKAYVAGLILYLFYALYLFTDKNGVINWIENHHAESIVKSMKADKPWIEETREFGGLLIMILVIGTNWVYSLKGISLKTQYSHPIPEKV